MYGKYKKARFFFFTVLATTWILKTKIYSIVNVDFLFESGGQYCRLWVHANRFVKFDDKKSKNDGHMLDDGAKAFLRWKLIFFNIDLDLKINFNS